MELIRVLAVINKMAVFLNSRNAEVIGHAADGDDQRVIGQRSARDVFLTVFIKAGLGTDLFLDAIYVINPAQPEMEMVPVCLGQIIKFVRVRIQRAGGDFMQQRLPQVGHVRVYEGDPGNAALAQGVTQLCREFQAAGAAADDDNMMWLRFFIVVHFVYRSLMGRFTGYNSVQCFPMIFSEVVMDERTRTELEAAAFRRLVRHLRDNPDVQNIDLMNLAGFCRNCLSKWYRAAAEDKGLSMDYEQAREIIYGMPYAEWKKKYQQEASEEQKKAYAARKEAEG